MNVLLIYNEKEENKYRRQIDSILSYWMRQGFQIKEFPRNESNDSSTCLEIEKEKFDYLVIINTVGFSGRTTGDLLNYSLMRNKQIFLILDSFLFDKYEAMAFALNQYFVISKSYSYYCDAEFLNKVLYEDGVESFDDIFDYIRNDCLEKDVLLKKEYNEGGKYLKDLQRKEEDLGNIIQNIESCFIEYNREKEKRYIDEILERIKSIDDYQAMYNLGKITALKKCFEIIQLEQISGVVSFADDCDEIELLINKYYHLTDVIRDIQFLRDNVLINKRLNWLVSKKISPFAIIIVLKYEVTGNVKDNYNKFIAFYKCLNDYCSVQILSAYSEKEEIDESK